MTLENLHVQLEIHLQMVDFPASHVGFRRSKITVIESDRILPWGTCFFSGFAFDCWSMM